MSRSTLTMEETKEANARLYDLLESGRGEDDNIKTAADEITSFTRTTIREDGFYRRIIPPQMITDNTQLTRDELTDKPTILVDREPDSPAAISMGFGDFPDVLYIYGSRYRVNFIRIATYMFSKDVDELRTYQMDLRQVISDNAIRDMMAEEDGKLIRAVNNALIGLNQVIAQTGVAQHVEINDVISRESLWESLKTMPTAPTNLEPHTILLNQLTIKDVGKLTFSQMGGPLAEEIMRNGWTLQTFLGKQWVITIKKGLVPTGTMYHFSDPTFIGKHFQLSDTVMWVKREGPMIYWYAYETVGGAIGNLGGLARVDFTG